MGGLRIRWFMGALASASVILALHTFHQSNNLLMPLSGGRGDGGGALGGPRHLETEAQKLPVACGRWRSNFVAAPTAVGRLSALRLLPLLPGSGRERVVRRFVGLVDACRVGSMVRMVGSKFVGRTREVRRFSKTNGMLGVGATMIRRRSSSNRASRFSLGMHSEVMLAHAHLYQMRCCPTQAVALWRGACLGRI